jgi:hypothetical protein
MAKRGPKPRPKPHQRWPRGKQRVPKVNKQVDRWLAECCAIDDPSAIARSRDLANSWLDWCHRNRLFSGVDHRAFGMQLSARSFVPFNSGRGWCRAGIRLLPTVISPSANR